MDNELTEHRIQQYNRVNNEVLTKSRVMDIVNEAQRFVEQVDFTGNEDDKLDVAFNHLRSKIVNEVR